METQIVKGVVVVLVFAIAIIIEAALFEVRWRQHENARFSMGVISVFLAALVGVYWGVLDGIPTPWNMYLVLVCVFGLFGVGGIVKWSFVVDRDALLNQSNLEEAGNGHGISDHV